MPKKYHIDTKTAPPRYTPVGKFGIVDFNEDCAGACKNCVKKECIYEIYKKEGIFNREIDGPAHYLYTCMNCLRCVQGCTRAVLTRVINPEFRWLGDDYWKPEIVLTLWYQAETGKLPVSGAGYRGPFAGPGFDSMWTDMSEIVRPTRDGIHGREYISTSVDIGRKHAALIFDDRGELELDPANIVENPIPFILQKPPFGDYSEKMHEAFARAAHEMNALFILDAADITANLKPFRNVIAPRVKQSEITKYAKHIKNARLVELVYDARYKAGVAAIKKLNPKAVVSLYVALDKASHTLAAKLAGEGIECIHFRADTHGRVGKGKDEEFIKDTFRRIHTLLVEQGTRDQITLIASGGIALPEHMAKIILCGADAVATGMPFLLALECRMCMNCTRGLECPVTIHAAPPEYGAQRILNLSAAWRNQLIEVLGAMGIREVRRLRGEVGRAMFIEDLEAATFGKIFGDRKKANPAGK
jgi:ferredoxin